MIGTIRGYSEDGVCIFCQKEKEGIDVEFEDGSFDGFLCLADLKRALRMRRNVRPDPEARAPLNGA